MRPALYLVAMAAGVSWIAIAEIIDGNIFLALNSIAGAVFILFSPWLFQLADQSPQAPSDTAPPSEPETFAGARGVAPAATRER